VRSGLSAGCADDDTTAGDARKDLGVDHGIASFSLSHPPAELTPNHEGQPSPRWLAFFPWARETHLGCKPWRDFAADRYHHGRLGSGPAYAGGEGSGPGQTDLHSACPTRLHSHSA
jgi:hypothetical protein